MSTGIEIGDKVIVNFHHLGMTLCSDAIVRHIPCATGDSWVFEEERSGAIHHISEPCSVTKLKDTTK